MECWCSENPLLHHSIAPTYDANYFPSLTSGMAVNSAAGAIDRGPPSVRSMTTGITPKPRHSDIPKTTNLAIR